MLIVLCSRTVFVWHLFSKEFSANLVKKLTESLLEWRNLLTLHTFANHQWIRSWISFDFRRSAQVYIGRQQPPLTQNARVLKAWWEKRAYFIFTANKMHGFTLINVENANKRCSHWNQLSSSLVHLMHLDLTFIIMSAFASYAAICWPVQVS